MNEMIAILLATYNGEKYIYEALKSIMEQTYKDFKVYIHDDGSSDQTIEYIRQFKDKYPDKIDIIEYPGLHSAKRNFLYLLRNVDSELYMFADQDDVWDKNKIEIMVDEYNRVRVSNRPILLFSDMCVVSSELEMIAESFIEYCNLDTSNLKLNRIIAQNVVPGCACLFNSKLRDESVKYDDETSIIHHDWWLACVAAATGEIRYVDKKTMLYRQHDNNVVGASRDNKMYELKKFAKLFVLNEKTDLGERTRRAIRQAKELRKCSFTDEKDRLMVYELDRFEDFTRLGRIKTFYKYHITRNKRNLWMYLFL